MTVLSASAAVSEGFCPNGHYPLTPVHLHGEDALACLTCECSWRFRDDGLLWGSACIPGDHTCGEG
jgi:hypothetical protein